MSFQSGTPDNVGFTLLISADSYSLKVSRWRYANIFSKLTLNVLLLLERKKYLTVFKWILYLFNFFFSGGVLVERPFSLWCLFSKFQIHSIWDTWRYLKYEGGCGWLCFPFSNMATEYWNPQPFWRNDGWITVSFSSLSY